MRESRRPDAASQISWPATLLTSLVASGAALGLMFFARDAFQIRTVPERVLEWLLIFVPLDLFERVLTSFGADAKVYATALAVAGTGLILLGLGLIVLRRGWSGWQILALGPLLWLFPMVVVMLATGAGLFATYLTQDVLLINVVYLAIGFAYASLLLLAGCWRSCPSSRPKRARCNRPIGGHSSSVSVARQRPTP